MLELDEAKNKMGANKDPFLVLIKANLEIPNSKENGKYKVAAVISTAFLPHPTLITSYPPSHLS